MALIPFPGSAAARPTPDDDPEEDDLDRDDGASGGKMSFLEHLDELRRRLVVVGQRHRRRVPDRLRLHRPIFAFIMRPLQQILPAGGKLVYTEPTEAFMLQLKVAALAGLVIAAPVIMWQLWLFVAPGLYARRSGSPLPFVLFSTMSFVGGAAFSHYIVFPGGVDVLRQLQQRLHAVHAEDLGSLRPVLVHDARLWRHLPDADAGAGAGAHGAGDGRLPLAAHRSTRS